MTGSGSKVAAECVSCGAIYAANRQRDGTIRPIGREGCRCGSAEFRVVDEPDDPADAFDSDDSNDPVEPD